MRLTKPQQNLVKDAGRSIYLEGPAGCGKTTAGIRRIQHLVQEGTPASSILLLVPQRALALPYESGLKRALKKAGGHIQIRTLGGLAQDMVELFFPLVAAEAGFGEPVRPPLFLSLETTQYFMMKVIEPIIDERGYFSTISIERNRLYSQLIDNLNKAAVVGFDYREVGERLKKAWIGEPAQLRVYDEVQECANLFRAYCLQHNLLDFSLQVELFRRYLWPTAPCRAYLTGRIRHLVADNIEEDTPAAHRVIGEWLPDLDSALLIADRDAGYRRFLGADPESARDLQLACDDVVVLERSFVQSAEMVALSKALRVMPEAPTAEETPAKKGKRSKKKPTPRMDPREALRTSDELRFFPQMVDWTAEEITRLIHDEGTNPREIVVLSPFLSDALRFALASRLEARGVPWRSHRPSRALREEPAARCLLILAKLAHPEWGLRPSSFDVTQALIEALDGLDLARARLLQQVCYNERRGELTPFAGIKDGVMRERITYVAGERFEALRDWLEAYRGEPAPEVDFFFSRLFGEVLSQPGYGFHERFDHAEAAANLIDSARGFRRTVTDDGREYTQVVERGILANQYISRWSLGSEDAVLLAPAYTFLMSNQPVDYQFWLNVGGAGWWERLYQPLTHPYVLTLSWPDDMAWTDTQEFAVRQEGLERLVQGLLRRCRGRVYLGWSQLGEEGREQRGPLLGAVQRMLRRMRQEGNHVPAA